MAGRRLRKTMPLHLGQREQRRSFGHHLSEADKAQLGKLTIDGQEYIAPKNPTAVRNLGRGHFGDVTEVTIPGLDKPIALKRIREESTSASAHSQMRTDLDIGRKANHPNIVSFYGFNYHEHTLFFFMELMKTDWLVIYRQVQREGGFIPETILAAFAVSAFDGLYYLKDQLNVMHRDVKPNNVLLGYDGAIKLCDFGIAKHEIADKDTLVAKTGVGCRRYIPPERLDIDRRYLPPDQQPPLPDAAGRFSTSSAAGVKYDVRSDVWAYGLTILELALLRYPFSDRLFEALNQIKDGDVPDIPERHYSQELRDFVSVCLEREVERRPKWHKESTVHAAIKDSPYLAQARDTAANPADLLQWYSSYEHVDVSDIDAQQ